jgi:Domain of unknown function (DUF4062)
MPETVRIIRVFVSSPGDVQAERDVLDEVVASINRTEGQAHGVRLELFKWEENVTPQIGPKPQQVVDAQTPADYDIYLGIMSTRFGTPTGGYGSGTEKEFKDALKKWKTARSPWITFYFDDDPKVSRKPYEAKQFVKVCEFREELESKGIVGNYTGVRGTKDAFFEKTAEHLRQIVHQLTPLRPKPSPPIEGKTTTKPAIPPQYIEWLLSRCGQLDLMGLEVKHGSGVRLNHVYTPLATSSRPEDTLRPAGRPEAGLPEQGRESRALRLEPRFATWLFLSPTSASIKTCGPSLSGVSAPASADTQRPFLPPSFVTILHVPPSNCSHATASIVWGYRQFPSPAMSAWSAPGASGRAGRPRQQSGHATGRGCIGRW